MTQKGGTTPTANSTGDRKCLACENSLAAESNYFNRYKVCQKCFKKKEFYLPEKPQPQRFCQKCGVPHDTLQFDGDRKSCRVGLKKHNDMRKKNRRRKKETEKGGLQAQNSQIKPHASWLKQCTPSGQLPNTGDLTLPRQTQQLRPYNFGLPTRAINQNAALNVFNAPHVPPFRAYSDSYHYQHDPIRQMLGTILSRYQERTTLQKEVGFQQFQPKKPEFFTPFNQFNTNYPAQNQQRIFQDMDPSMQLQQQQQQQQYNQILQQQVNYNWINQIQRDNSMQTYDQSVPFQSQQPPAQINNGIFYGRGNFQTVNSGENSNNETNMQFPANHQNGNTFNAGVNAVGDCGEIAEVADLFVTPPSYQTQSNSQSDFSQQQTNNQIINSNCYQEV